MIIDNEFKARIPTPSPEEIAQLEENIKADGCLDALVTWNGILLDGHHRLEICQRLGIAYKTIEIDLPDRDAALDWIDKTQLGRRNLSPDQASLLRGRRYNRAKKAANDGGKGTPKATVGQNDPRFTADKLAKEHSVSPATIKRDGKFEEAVSIVRPYILDIDDRVMSGDIPSRQAVIDAAKEPDLAEEKLMPHVARNGGENEWYTPPEFIKAAEDVMGCIDFDPASSDIANEIVGASEYCTIDHDGLTTPWTGRVWMNPPYAQPLISKFCQKLIDSIVLGDVTEAIVMVNNASETRWFQQLMSRAALICFPMGRVRFLDIDGNEGAPLQGQAVFYFGISYDLFIEHFMGFGAIVKIV